MTIDSALCSAFGMHPSDADDRYARLSNRQREVAEYLADGLCVKEIARTLGSSPKTIETHVGQVKDRLRADSLVGVVKVVLLCRVAEALKRKERGR